MMLEKISINLPRKWIKTNLNTITKKIVDGTHFTPTYTSKGIPFLSVKDIKNGKISFTNCKFISKTEHKKLFKRCNPQLGDILITKSGTIGRIAVVNTSQEFSLFVSVALLKSFKKFINSKFLALNLENFINFLDIKQSVKGGVIKNFHLEDLRLVPIKLAPLEEQKRIVSKIEELFSKIDLSKQFLTKIIIQLENYRQSSLKFAFTEQKWPKKSLGELIQPSKEKFNPKKEKNKIFIGLEHIESKTGRILGKGNSINTKSTKNVFNKGDVLYGRLRPYLNKVCVSNFKGVCSTDILVFPKNLVLESKFLFYYLCELKPV